MPCLKDQLRFSDLILFLDARVMYPVTGPRKIKVKKTKRNQRQASMMYKSIVNNPKAVSHTVRLVCLSILLMTHCVNLDYDYLVEVTKMLQTISQTDDSIILLLLQEVC